MTAESFTHKLLYRKKTSVFDNMLDRLIALLPAAVVGCIYFGYHAVMLLFSCALAAAATEWLLARLFKIDCRPQDLCSVVTGLLIAMAMPASMPVLAAVAVTVSAVAVSRMFFGGYGCEIVNPAALGAALAWISFPKLMTEYADAFTHNVTTVVPLTAPEGTFGLKQLIFGAHAGAIGEVGALFLVLGALYLFIRRVYTVTVPLAAVASTLLFSFLFSMDVSVSLLGGGLLLGAIFMLPEEATSPENISGQLVFSFFCGLVTVLIRRFAAAPEGIYFAILAVNLLRPLFSAIPEFKIKGAEKNEA